MIDGWDTVLIKVEFLYGKELVKRLNTLIDNNEICLVNLILSKLKIN